MLRKKLISKKLVPITENCSGADIKAICTEAGMFAIRQNKISVSQKEFEEAIKKVLGKAISCGEGPVGMYA